MYDSMYSTQTTRKYGLGVLFIMQRLAKPQFFRIYITFRSYTVYIYNVPLGFFPTPYPDTQSCNLPSSNCVESKIPLEVFYHESWVLAQLMFLLHFLSSSRSRNFLLMSRKLEEAL